MIHSRIHAGVVDLTWSTGVAGVPSARNAQKNARRPRRPASRGGLTLRRNPSPPGGEVHAPHRPLRGRVAVGSTALRANPRWTAAQRASRLASCRAGGAWGCCVVLLSHWTRNNGKAAAARAPTRLLRARTHHLIGAPFSEATVHAAPSTCVGGAHGAQFHQP